MKGILFIALSAIVLISMPCSAQRQHDGQPSSSGGPLAAEQAAYDVSFYDIQLSVHPERESIAGEVTIHASVQSAQSVILLDLDDRLDVERVEVRTAAGPWMHSGFEHQDGRLRIVPDDPLQEGDDVEVRVTYGGAPRVAPSPPWIGGFTWASTQEGRPWIATSVQMDGADLWIPVKDHPSDKPDSVRLTVTVPSGLIVASNGILRNTTSSADSTTFEWFTGQPISNYNVALNIAPYRQIETTYTSIDGTQVPVSFWVLPERYDAGRQMLPQFLDHLRWFEEMLGPYPFRAEKYGIAHTPHLGMEHQTIIAYGSTFSNNPWGFDWLHHHELAHEWWANLVTASDWSDFWIHEGFGTYMQPLYIEHLHGRTAYRQEMASIRPNINNRKAVAPRTSHSASEMYFMEGAGTSDNDIYYKGAWVLHTLRYLIGDDDFFDSLRRFAYPDDQTRRSTDGSQVRFVTTDDYRVLVEEIADRNLEWFFNIYLRQPQLPRLNVSQEGETLTLQWEVPGDLPFPMPIDISIDGDVRRVEVSEQPSTIRLPAGAVVAVDPQGWVLKE